MSEQGVAVRQGRGRRPAAEVRQAVLTAAGELLFETGLTGITFEKVAQRAGASKMTLYKWWPSPGALALEAYFAAVKASLAFPDTGDVERDLTSQLHAFVHLITEQSGGRVIAELVGAAQTDPDLASAFAESYTRPRRQLAVDTFVRAQERGQIRADVDPEVLVDQLWGACYHRLLLPDQPLTLAFADALIRNLMLGIRGPASPHS
ncbi:TetR/AcrR family transcriptional regulator C-terminal ligand-binding domain-containing protein [Glaciihabitans sp. dw_435]|uniref:TetR/AcrR family transcriptional regulator n=1 Tax=Glaciihabitans sp. dw_435 TaxID=2720081 RepID=UPI0027DC3B98|nr:TetR/AcrR family transcriptional regulator C-terminal ligand-binding domain-containing protein [Glaciihabitans sp. dw_435]